MCASTSVCGYMCCVCLHSDNDINEMGIPQSFVVERDRFGKLVHRELKLNGQNEIVTNENKAEYVR